MAVTEHIAGVDGVSPGTTAASLFSSIKSLAHRVKLWAKICADYYAAAAMYEQLSKLSNAEFHRRGLLRDTLARSACQSCDRTVER